MFDWKTNALNALGRRIQTEQEKEAKARQDREKRLKKLLRKIGIDTDTCVITDSTAVVDGITFHLANSNYQNGYWGWGWEPEPEDKLVIKHKCEYCHGTVYGSFIENLADLGAELKSIHKPRHHCECYRAAYLRQATATTPSKSEMQLLTEAVDGVSAAIREVNEQKSSD